MKNILSQYKNIVLTLGLGMGILLSSCSDEHMTDVNTDTSKAEDMNPNAELTTALLQTYGDFQVMDTYRCYITGFTQYYAGGWNVSNYAGANYAENATMKSLWDRYYTIAVKNLVDGISRSGDMPNVNAALRIQRAYYMALLSDVYGDIPCSEAGMGYTEGIALPKYDTQEKVYDFILSELKAASEQLDANNSDAISGDCTSLGKDVDAWKRYANSLRMRYAMRISDVAPEKAKSEFLAAYNAGCIKSADQEAYVIYQDSPFTLYDGATDLDYRGNALGEMLYGQDPQSPTFVCSTLYYYMQDNNDPRLSQICRNYICTTRSQTDTSGNYDVTDEVEAWKQRGGTGCVPCNVGDAWWSDWINGPANSEIPTLEKLVAQNPDAGYDKNNYPARMLRPSLAVGFEKTSCPGYLISYAEVEFLLAEAASKGWISENTEEHYHNGIRATMNLMNEHYGCTMSSDDIEAYIAAHPLTANPRECINYEAWILHIVDPSEGWANLRRADYPAIADRTLLPLRTTDFTYDDPNMQTPTRLKYPNIENEYNKDNFQAAISRLGGSDDWHKKMWWDVNEQNFVDIKDIKPVN